MSYLGVIGGSGMNLESQFDTIEACEVSTIFGKPSAPVQKMSVSELDFCFLARHGNPHRIAPHQVNYRANLQALCSRGVEIVLAINAVGAISQSLLPGQLIVPDQIIDYTWGRQVRQVLVARLARFLRWGGHARAGAGTETGARPVCKGRRSWPLSRLFIDAVDQLPPFRRRLGWRIFAAGHLPRTSCSRR